MTMTEQAPFETPPPPPATETAPPKLPMMKAGGAILAIIPQSFEEAYRLAKVAYIGGICPSDCKSAENAMVRILHGLEVGLPPMAALQSIAVINGRPVVWGDAAIALVRQSGKAKYIKEYENEFNGVLTAFCETHRVGDPEPIIRSWSVEDERVAGLANKDIHKAYPKRMRQMRARAFCLRDTYADVLRGLGIREEVEDYNNTMRDVTPAATPKPRPPVPDEPAPQAALPKPAEQPMAPVPPPPVPEPVHARPPLPEAEPVKLEPVDFVEEVIAETAYGAPVSEDWGDAQENEEFAAPPQDIALEEIEKLAGHPGHDAADEPAAPPPAAESARPRNSGRKARQKRRLTSDENEWLHKLQNALADCTTEAEFGAVQATVMVPREWEVCEEAWTRATRVSYEHFARIVKAKTP